MGADVLDVVKADEWMSCTDILSLVNINRSSLSYSLKKLSFQKAVVRRWSHQEKGRKQYEYKLNVVENGLPKD